MGLRDPNQTHSTLGQHHRGIGNMIIPNLEEEDHDMRGATESRGMPREVSHQEEIEKN